MGAAVHELSVQLPCDPVGDHVPEVEYEYEDGTVGGVVYENVYEDGDVSDVVYDVEGVV